MEVFLQESEERYRFLVEGTRDYGIFLLDAEGLVSSWNKGVENNKGYIADEIIGKHYSVFYSDDDVESGVPELQLMGARLVGRYEGEGWRLRKDGSRFWANVVITPLYDDSGELYGFSNVTRDVTERKRMEEALRKSEGQFRLILESGMDGVSIVADDKLVYINNRFSELLGYDKSSGLIGMENIKIVHSSSRHFILRRNKLRRQGESKPAKYEVEMLRKDGSTFHAEVLSSVIDYEGKPARLAFTRDITERKRKEEEVLYLNRLLLAIRNVNQLIVQERDRDKLRDGVTRLLVEMGGYFNAWIALFDEEGRLASVSQSGLGDGFQPLLGLIEGGGLPECGRKALEQPGVHVTGDPVSECTDCPLSGSYHGRSAHSVRLEHGGKVYGLLAASVPRHLITEEEKLLFKEIADDIGYALRSMEVEDEKKRGEWTLRERVKELNCLYAVSNLRESGLDLEEILRGVAALVPPAMQHPEEACVRITLDGRSYETDVFRETSRMLFADIKIHGEDVGSLMVCYPEEGPEGEGGLFLPEEGELVNAVAERLGRII